MSLVTCLLLSVIVTITSSKENYCPGDDKLLIPSHSSYSNWPGWSCRRHSMTFKGDLKNLESIDFQAIEDANKTILRIHLTNRKLTTIPSNIFHPLKSLKQLDLHLNATLLTSDIFNTLTNLKHLSIYSYQERLPQNIFSHLSNLKYLKLFIRPIGTRLKPQQKQCPEFNIPKYEDRNLNDMITSRLLRPLTKLEFFSISCECTSIPANTFRYQSQLVTLILKTNISEIPNNLFNRLYVLNKLKIQSKTQHLILPQPLFNDLHSLDTLEIECKSIYLPPNLFMYTRMITFISFHSRLENIHSNLFQTLNELFWLDLGSTDTTSLPEILIHNNSNLRHLRLEANGIKHIPKDFFRYSQKLNSLIVDNNEIEVLDEDVFHPLRSLHDIHLQHNRRFEMYCDYGFGNLSLFPELRSVYMHSMSHQCIQPWVGELQTKRAGLNVYHTHKTEKLDNCPLIKVDDIPASIAVNTSILIQFEGPNIFIKHKAYWVLSNVSKCSDFREISNFNSDEIGHAEVGIEDNGIKEFFFKQRGKFMLVYKYGDKAPFIPYYNLLLEVL